MKFIALVLLFTATAFAHPAPDFLGKWEAENVIMGRGVEFKLDFDFTENEMNMTVHCYFYDGAYLRASASSWVEYRQNHIYIQETQDVSANDGYRFCRATLRPSVWTASFDGTGRMTLHVPTPYQSYFRLVPVLN